MPITTISALHAHCREALAGPLPGHAAHVELYPLAVQRDAPAPTPQPDARLAAALALLVGDTPELLLTVRSMQLSHHGGQISFPGGRRDAEETAEQTALRETEEELGIARQEIAVLGRLSELYIPPSNHLVQPILGWVPQLPALRLQASEVQEAFTVPLARLADPASRKVGTWETRGQRREVPYWDVHPTPFWGATAMMTEELLQVMRPFMAQRDH